MAQVGRTPPHARMVVYIDAVEPGKRRAHVRSRRYGKLLVSWRGTGSMFQIPEVGERWIIERRDSWDWLLVNRIDEDDEASTKAGLNRGDAHQRVPGTLLIEATGLKIRSKGSVSDPKPFGAPYQDRWVGNGSRRTVALTKRWVHEDSVLMFAGGQLVDPATLTFDSPPTSWSAALTVSGPTGTLSGGIVKPTAPNATGKAYEAQNSGTTGGTEPIWPVKDGGTVKDGSITWKCRPVISLAFMPSVGNIIVAYYQAV